MVDARAEEVDRKAEAQVKREREQEVKDADKDAAEMADLLANDPEVYPVDVLCLVSSIRGLKRDRERERGVNPRGRPWDVMTHRFACQTVIKHEY